MTSGPNMYIFHVIYFDMRMLFFSLYRVLWHVYSHLLLRINTILWFWVDSGHLLDSMRWFWVSSSTTSAISRYSKLSLS